MRNEQDLIEDAGVIRLNEFRAGTRRFRAEHPCSHQAVSRRSASGCADVANYPPTNVLSVLKVKFYAKVFAV
jgi:hypothetical protein